MPDTNQPAFNDPILNRFFLSPQEKADKEKGKAIVKAFYLLESTNDGLSFWKQRSARWIQLLLWAKGSQPMQEFLDYLSVSDANKSYVNIDTTQQRIATQFLSTLVTSMSKNKLYPCVKAVDDGSKKEKEDREFEAIYRMHEAQTIDDVQQQSGLQLEPSNVFVPDDPLAAKVHFQIADQLPKEIRFEKMLNKLQKDIKFERVLSPKGLYDLITLNFEATVIERLAPKEYTVRKCIPTNCIYNFFMNDTGECEVTMFGEFYNLKVRDFRSKYGKTDDRPNGLTEKQIYELAKLSTNKNNGKFSYQWQNNWANTSFNVNINRPYDDCSILVLDTRINCGEDVYYVSKPDFFGKENIEIKRGVPYQPQIKRDGTVIIQEKPDDVEITKRNKSSWMRGVYAPYGDTMLYWGAPDLIVPNFTDSSKALPDFSINIPMNDGEYVPSLFERGMEILREYSITKLKRKQLIAALVPDGIRIDVAKARNLGLGVGDDIAWEEVVKVYNQTGHELYSSEGVDPLSPQAPALSNTVQRNTIQKVIELSNVLAGMRMELREVWGVPQYRDGSDVGDRTSGVLQEQQNKSSFNVTDYILNGHKQLWEETFYKVCLLHWNDIVQEEPESQDDMLNTRFDVSITMKDTEYERQILEQDIQRYSQMPDKEGNPLLSPKDAMVIRNIEDYKLACDYLDSVVSENRKKAIQDSERLQAQNAQVQQQSAQQAAEMQQQMQQEKLQAEKEMKDFESTKAKELALLNGILNIASKNLGVPPEFAGLIQLLVPNIAIPLSLENKQMVQAAQMQAQQEQMAEMQQQQAQQQGQPDQPQQMQQPQAA